MNEGKFLISDVPVGDLETMVQKLMKQSGISSHQELIRKINSDELDFKVNFDKADIRILKSFNLNSEGLNGSLWEQRLRKKGNFINKYAQAILQSQSFSFTNGDSHKVSLISSSQLNNKSVRDIMALGLSVGYQGLNAESACMLFESMNISKLIELDLDYIIIMHKPVFDYFDSFGVLIITRNDRDGTLLLGSIGLDQICSNLKCAFAFAEI